MKNLLLSFLALTALSCEAKENKNKTDMDTTHTVTENTENSIKSNSIIGGQGLANFMNNKEKR